MIQEQIRSATIYQFPVGGRGGLRASGDTRRTAISDIAMPRSSALAGGESWYHAEAIRDADKATT